MNFWTILLPFHSMEGKNQPKKQQFLGNHLCLSKTKWNASSGKSRAPLSLMPSFPIKLMTSPPPRRPFRPAWQAHTSTSFSLASPGPGLSPDSVIRHAWWIFKQISPKEGRPSWDLAFNYTSFFQRVGHLWERPRVFFLSGKVGPDKWFASLFAK